MPPFNVWDERSGGDTWESSTGMYRSKQNELFKKMYSNLYTPDEFDNLPAGIKSLFGNYMSYARAFQKNQGTTYQPSAPRATRAIPGVKYGSAKKSATGSKIPTRIHRGLGDTTSIELSGGGTRRGLGGELQYQTPEQIEAVGTLKRRSQFAIPEQERLGAIEAQKYALAPTELATKAETAQGKLSAAKSARELAEFRGTRPVEERYGMSKQVLAKGRLGETQARTQIAQEALQQRADNLVTKYGQQEAMEKARQEGRVELAKIKSNLKMKNKEQEFEYRGNLLKLKATNDLVKQKAIAQRQIQILNLASEKAGDRQEQSAYNSEIRAWRAYQQKIQLGIMARGYDKETGESEQGRVGIPQAPVAPVQPTLQPPAPQQSGGPQVGGIYQDHEYLGGPTNDPDSWRKL